MNDQIEIASSSRYERRYRRFKLRFPVHLSIISEHGVSEVEAVSRDISTGGILLESRAQLLNGSPVTFVISLSGRRLRPVQLSGQGTIVRVERNANAYEFAVAVECKTPLIRVEANFPFNAV